MNSHCLQLHAGVDSEPQSGVSTHSGTSYVNQKCLQTPPSVPWTAKPPAAGDRWWSLPESQHVGTGGFIGGSWRSRIDILGISELKWTGMGEFNSDDHYIYYWARGPATSTGSLASQRHPGKFPKVPGALVAAGT